MTDKTFGSWLKLQRTALDLSQQELADQAGCSVVTIRKLESDERKPSKQLADLLGSCLNVPETERSRANCRLMMCRGSWQRLLFTLSQASLRSHLPQRKSHNPKVSIGTICQISRPCLLVVR
ncbi:helix-turn-helix transcriptional regulator [Chloroflexi bacterium TSY]|nr:helix-turn-helix transcriptional regulator [Chloroflexi bacterium TSY]